MKLTTYKSETCDTVESSGSNLFTQLYREHRGLLISRLRRVYGAGPPDPEDLAQSAFEKLIALKPETVIENPGAYLYRLAVNAGLDQVKRNSTARKYAYQIVENTSDLQNISPENVYIGKEQLSELERLISRLPKLDKELIYRSRIKGETLTEIAGDMKISISKASRHLSKALAQLQVELERCEVTDE